VGEHQGGPTIRRYDGDSWHEIPPPDTGAGISDVTGINGQIWIAGHGGVWRYDSGEWTGWPEIDAIAIWGASPADVFAAGGRRIWIFDGQTWNEQPAAESWTADLEIDLVGLWGSSASDVYAVGGNLACACGENMALHWNGTGWSLAPLQTEAFIKSIWGMAADDIFAVGGSSFTGLGGEIFRFDGTQWTSIGQGKTDFLTAIGGTSGTDVFAVGLEGEIRHFDGYSWTEMKSGVGQNLRDVWAAPTAEVAYAVGAGGTILRLDR
jgi:hypothetical protein